MPVRHRGNGQGCARRLKTNNWQAIATIGFDDNNKRIVRTKSGFKTKSEALAYVPVLKKEKTAKERITLLSAYRSWLDYYKDSISHSTLNCYISGFNVFEECWYFPIADQDIEELQRCIDECDKGTRTKQNAKTCLGLVYKWAIPRGYVDNNLNLGSFLKVRADSKSTRHGFSPAQLEEIRKNVGIVPFADIIYCHCLLGFRPSELLELKVSDYNDEDSTFVGGSKTEAGKNRTVTVSPKLIPILKQYLSRSADEYVFSPDGKKLGYKKYCEKFYKALELCGIQNAIDHTLSPHSCRHTFATLLKQISAPDTDKMELIGHSSSEMLRYYQDVNLDDLRRITDQL